MRWPGPQRRPSAAAFPAWRQPQSSRRHNSWHPGVIANRGAVADADKVWLTRRLLGCHCSGSIDVIGGVMIWPHGEDIRENSGSTFAACCCTHQLLRQVQQSVLTAAEPVEFGCCGNPGAIQVDFSNAVHAMFHGKLPNCKLHAV